MFMICDMIGHGMTCGEITMNSFIFSHESQWDMTKISRISQVTLNSNESPIENNLNKIIKIVLHVTLLVGFSSFLDF